MRITLSKKRRIPLTFINEREYYPWQLHKIPRDSLLDYRDSKRMNIEHKDNGETMITVDGVQIMLAGIHASTIVHEYFREWKKYYVPQEGLQGKTILDIGAGCGECFPLWFASGAKSIIAIESGDWNPKSYDCLTYNAAHFPIPITVLHRKFSLADLELQYDYMKMDIEGGEGILLELPDTFRLKPCVIEAHYSKDLANDLCNRFSLKSHKISPKTWLLKSNVQAYSQNRN